MIQSRNSSRQYFRRLRTLLKRRFFWILTICGNGVVLLGSVLLQFCEADHHDKALSFVDYLLWSAGTVTTVGYGNLTPLTFGGKITLLFLMLLGPLFIWLYMAFWVTGMLAPELAILEHEVHKVESEIKSIKMKASDL